MRSTTRFLILVPYYISACCAFATETIAPTDPPPFSFERELVSAILNNDCQHIETNIAILARGPFLFSDSTTNLILGIRDPLSLACYVGNAGICQLILNNIQGGNIVCPRSVFFDKTLSPVDFALASYMQGRGDMESIVFQLVSRDNRSFDIVKLCTQIIERAFRQHMDNWPLKSKGVLEAFALVDRQPAVTNMINRQLYALTVSRNKDLLSIHDIAWDNDFANNLIFEKRFGGPETITSLAKTIDQYFSYPSFSVNSTDRCDVLNSQIQLVFEKDGSSGSSDALVFIRIHFVGDPLKKTHDLVAAEPCSGSFSLVWRDDGIIKMKPLFSMSFVVIDGVPIFMF